MPVLSAASLLLLYLTTNQLSRSKTIALLATALYALSPLSLLYRREVLLDDIAIFWLLLSLCLITSGKSQLRSIVVAALALGMAILTRDIYIIFLPILLYGVWLYATQFQRKFAVLSFLFITLTMASLYVLFAALKGELLPPGLLPWDKGTHPSLVRSEERRVG